MKRNERAQLTAERGNIKANKLAGLIKDHGNSDNIQANWGDVDGQTISMFVALVAANSGAILLGVSRDGTQFHVKIYAGNGSKNYWFAGTPDGIQDMYDWISAFSDALLG